MPEASILLSWGWWPAAWCQATLAAIMALRAKLHPFLRVNALNKESTFRNSPNALQVTTRCHNKVCLSKEVMLFLLFLLEIPNGSTKNSQCQQVPALEVDLLCTSCQGRAFQETKGYFCTSKTVMSEISRVRRTHNTDCFFLNVELINILKKKCF